MTLHTQKLDARARRRIARLVARQHQRIVYWSETVAEEFASLLKTSGRVQHARVIPTGRLPEVEFGGVHGTPITEGRMVLEGLPFSNHDARMTEPVHVEITMFAGRQLILPHFDVRTKLRGTPRDHAAQLFDLWARHLDAVAAEDVNWRPVGADVSPNTRTAHVTGTEGAVWPSGGASVLEEYVWAGQSGPESLETFDTGATWGRAPGVWQCSTAPTPTMAELNQEIRISGVITGQWDGRELVARCAIRRDRPYLHVERVELFDGRTREKTGREACIRFDDFLSWAQSRPDVALQVGRSRVVAGALTLTDRLRLRVAAMGASENVL